MTDSVLQKLEYAFRLGCSDREACIEANIAPQTLYNYQSSNPEFLEQKEVWKCDPVLKARKTVVAHLSQDPNLAMKYLEKKLPDEFGTKKEATTISPYAQMTPADLVRMIEERNRKIRHEFVSPNFQSEK